MTARRASGLAALLCCAAAFGPVAGQTPVRTPALFPPSDLAFLEAPDREEWQQPDRVLDTLGVADGGRVADVGAGGGWFTIRLARRVGPNGRVFAEDVQQAMIDRINRRVATEGLRNVETILGTPDDARLPAGLHAVLMVDAFPHVPDPVAMLRKIAPLLVPSGRVGVIDFRPDGGGGPGPPREERVAPERVIAAAEQAGLVLIGHETFLRYQYMLIFGRKTDR